MSADGFYSLRHEQCAFLDVTSLAFVKEQRVAIFDCRLDSDLNIRLFEWLRSQHSSHLTEALEVLERMVAYEFLAVDELALGVSGLAFPELEFVRPLRIPTEVYGKTITRMYQESRLSSIAYEFGKVQHWDCGDDKLLFDRLAKSTDLMRISRSNQSAARVLFYMQLASDAGVPVFLNPLKDRFIHEYGAKFTPDVLKVVEQVVDEAVAQAFRDIVSVAPKRSMPPIADYVVRHAIDGKLTIMESLREIRNSKPALAFRTWLWDIQRLLFSETRPEWCEAAKKMNELRRVTRLWADTFDFGLGVEYRRRSIKVGLPSAILGIATQGADVGVSLRDPVIWGRPLYLTFIADWYRR